MQYLGDLAHGEHACHPINSPCLFLSSTMYKRGGDSTHVRPAKVKKRKGVGSRTINVPDSDEDLPPMTANDYARVTKTCVGTAGKAEKVATRSIPIFEAEKVGVRAPLEENVDGFVDITENIISVVPARRRKRANDSVSHPSFLSYPTLLIILRPRCTLGSTCGLLCSTKYSVSTAQAIPALISAAYVQTIGLLPRTAALSVPTHRFIAASVFSSCTGSCHCIVWRFVYFFNVLPSSLILPSVLAGWVFRQNLPPFSRICLPPWT